MIICEICGKPVSEKEEARLKEIRKTGSIRETAKLEDLTLNELEAYIKFLEQRKIKYMARALNEL